MSDYDDNAVIKLIKSNKRFENDKAFKQLYSSCFPVIQKNIINNSGDEQDAEDIFQDGLIVLYHQIKKGNLDLSCSIKTYLYSVCRNLWLKNLRKNKRNVELSDTLKSYISIEESSLKTLEESEHKKIIQLHLDQLSSGCKDILLYFYFEKMKMSEIATLMNLANEQVAKNKKAGCMKKLKALIKDSSFFKD